MDIQFIYSCGWGSGKPSHTTHTFILWLSIIVTAITVIYITIIPHLTSRPHLNDKTVWDVM
jgi:hypothetical protein